MFRTTALAIALTALVACGDDDTGGTTTTTTGDDTTTTTVEETTTTTQEEPDEAALGQECSFDDAGWTITVARPDGWVTNEETEFEHGTVPACRLFDREDATPPRPNELTAFGVILHVDDVAYDRATSGDPLDAERLSEEETTVAGQAARRVEDRLTEGGIRGPEGARVTTWTVDLDGSILVASTHEVADLDYEQNRDVLDAMVRALELTRT